MSHTIECKYYQTGIRDFAEAVRAYLADALLPCVGPDPELFVAGMILATKNGEPLPSWRLNPACLGEEAPADFCRTYARELQQIALHVSPGAARSLPLRRMIHDRLAGLDAGQQQDFVRQALRHHTDLSSLFNLLRFCPFDDAALCDRLCRTYHIPRKDYPLRMSTPAKEAMQVRNIYVGHDSVSVFRAMTPDRFEDVLDQLLAPAVCLAGPDPAPLEALRARRDEMVRTAHCRPLPLTELEQAIPEFDVFVLKKSRFSPQLDFPAGVLYLHTLEEVEQELETLRRHFDTTSDRMRRQEQRSDAIQEIQAELQSSLTALTRRVRGQADDTADSPAPLEPFPRMQTYEGGPLTEAQQTEIFTRCHVLADASCWLSREGQRFLMERVLPLQKDSGKRVIVDWATRVELYHRELDPQSTPAQRSRAHDARIVMSHLHRQGKINYAPERAGIRSSQSSLLDVLARNPGRTVCLLTIDWDFCTVLAHKAPANVMPLLVGTNLSCTVHPVLRALVRRNSLAPREDLPAEPVPAPADGTPSASPAVICETGVCLPWQKPEEGMQLQTGSGAEVVLGPRLGSGGEGDVFTTNDPALVAKLYNKRHLTANRRDKLQLMLEKDPRIDALCWPTALLYHPDGSFAGFLMPRIDPAYRELTTSVLQLGKPTVQQQLSGWDRLALVRLCLQLCRLLERLHRADILLGDINPRNILVRTSDPEHPSLVVVDCDSCQIDRYPCPVGTVLHTSPALYKRLNTDTPRYGTFLRTPEDEDYAMTVLLFELLMLNQPPFGGKGVTDLGQAVREGRFTYRFTPKGSREAVSDGNDTPDGPYRMIWGNMPYLIREGFYNTFARGKPEGPAHWSGALQNYEHDILTGGYSRDLTPRRYFDWDGSRTVDFTCEECGAQSNMPRQRWENNHRYGRLNLCNTCYSAMLRLQKDPELVPVHCVNCGKVFLSNKWQATLESRGQARRGAVRDRLCPDCRQTVQVTCAGCGKTFTMTKAKRDELARRGTKPRCRTCFAARR